MRQAQGYFHFPYKRDHSHAKEVVMVGGGRGGGIVSLVMGCYKLYEPPLTQMGEAINHRKSLLY